MAPPMFGVESEYAVAGINGKGPMRHEDLLNRLVRVAQRELVHLPDLCASSGMFLENGSRLYVDCGFHPELATPECTNPFELARYIKAGESIMERLMRAMQADAGPSAEIMCFRCNVDYSGTGSTWGCHESYLHSGDPSGLPDQLIPHLVTRVIYTGAGGFNPLAGGLEFCVAPRLMHIQQAISRDSTGNRGIFHTKNEPLAGKGYNRLHILCGESLCSETAVVLKVGATALVAAMAAEGLKPGTALRLAAPLEALHAVSSDITCRRKLPLAGGGETTAIEIQRRLLQLAERHRSTLPPWAGAICALWRCTLDQLENAPDAVATVLDWAIKHRLYRDRAESRGIPMEQFASRNSIVQPLTAALAAVGMTGRDVPLSAIRQPDSPIAGEVARVGNALAAAGLAWGDLEQFLKLRNEFYQIDTRFGQIGPRGIFAALDGRGVLDHKVAGVEDIDAAMRQPPAVGRAKLRGEIVRRLSGQPRAGCHWISATSPDGRTLDLSDPFAAAEVWIDPPAPPASIGDGPSDIPDLFEDAGRFQRMIDAFRGRHVRHRTGAQGPPETSENPRP